MNIEVDVKFTVVTSALSVGIIGLLTDPIQFIPLAIGLLTIGTVTQGDEDV